MKVDLLIYMIRRQKPLFSHGVRVFFFGHEIMLHQLGIQLQQALSLLALRKPCSAAQRALEDRS